MALAAFIATGTVKGAADRLGKAESTVRRHLDDYLRLNKVESLAMAIYLYDRPDRNSAKSAILSAQHHI
jgi:hypothetical protein